MMRKSRGLHFIKENLMHRCEVLVSTFSLCGGAPAMASSRKWACIISSVASSIYFLVIFFQIPLFRVRCTSGLCRTPIQVTCSQLVASELFPTVVVKALLYPGAIANAFFKNTTIPNYNNLLNLYHFTNLTTAPATSDLQRIEVLAGSYLSIAGAILGVIKRSRMGLISTLLILWGLVREATTTKSSDTNPVKPIDIYPTMSIALLSAFFSIRRDVRKIVRISKGNRNAKHSWTLLRAKHV
ncbi:uncharacterized protein LOC132187988 [Corylus avellana]|uniref:uncharacterized protein LOC132187988 n=1 Tax=Corylus avellana TaxID=13451 RepID=UPI00286D077A|nr:uncharacterized protein LOC132187988 [Corylus avellana]